MRKLFLKSGAIVILFLVMFFATSSAIAENLYTEKIDSVWGQLIGAYGDQNEIDEKQGYEYTSSGFVLGYDSEINKNLILGFAGGYMITDLKSDTAGVGSDVDTYSIGIYASYIKNRMYIDGALLYGYGDIDNTRPNVSGNTRSDSIAIAGEIGYEFYGPKFLTIIPFISGKATSLKIDGYTEKGTAGLIKEVDDISDNFFSMALGLVVDAPLSEKLFLESRIKWMHEFSSDLRPETGKRNVGDTGAFALEKGINLGDDILSVGLGVRYIYSKEFSIDTNIEIEKGKQFMSKNISLLCRWTF